MNLNLSRFELNQKIKTKCKLCVPCMNTFGRAVYEVCRARPNSILPKPRSM